MTTGLYAKRNSIFNFASLKDPPNLNQVQMSEGYLALSPASMTVLSCEMLWAFSC